MSGPDIGEVPRSACVFVMAPATWRRRFEDRGEARDPGMEMGSICLALCLCWRGKTALLLGNVRIGDEAAPALSYVEDPATTWL